VRTQARSGFTLAEVAVTLVIVGIGLLFVLQGLSASKLLSARTYHRKVARDLALYTLGQLESGLFWEELEGRSEVLSGSYAEEGFEEFHYELVLGDDEFSTYEGDQGAYHDSWAYERDRQDRLSGTDPDEDEDEDQASEPFEKARIKVTFPAFSDQPGELVLERWIPWEQVYGASEDEAAAEEPSQP